MESFITELSLFFRWLLTSTIQVGVLICLILVVKAILRNRLAVRWHYWLWLVLLIRMAIPSAPQSNFSLYTLISQAERAFVTERIAQVPPLPEPADKTAHITPAIAPEATNLPEVREPVTLNDTAQPWPQSSADKLPFMIILSLLWFAVALVLGIFALVCNFRLWRIIRSQRPLTEGRTLDLLEDCKARMGVHTILGVIITDKVKSPALFGVIRPRLLLPKGLLETLSRDELRYVFLHELAHLKRHDIYLGWFMVILQVLHWFNPLVWFAFHRMRADRELACDGLGNRLFC